VRARITTDGNHVLADIPYARGEGPEWAKKIPGSKPVYEHVEGREKDMFLYWRYPLTMDTCRTFRRVFGSELQVEPALSIWARAAIAAGEALEQLRDGAIARLPRVESESPFLHAAMMDRSYQPAGAAFIALAGQCILGDEPGLGKTLQTLAALIEADCKDILVGCPRTATRNVWERETRRWAPNVQVFVAQGSRAEREDAMDGYAAFRKNWPEVQCMLIINNEMIRAKRFQQCKEYKDWSKDGNFSGRWTAKLQYGKCKQDHPHRVVPEYEWPFLFKRKWDAIVIDESHNLLASTYNVGSKSITQGRYGAMKLRHQLRPQGLAIALSGTPFRSKLTKSWGTLNWCRPDVFGSYWNFAGNHFGVEEGRYGKVVAGGAKVPKPLNQEGFDAAIRPYYLARTKEMAAPDLPPILYVGVPPENDPDGMNGIWLDMDPKQTKSYNSMAALAEAKLRGGLLTANGTLAEITRLRQFSTAHGYMEGNTFVPGLPSNKVDWILQFLLEREGHPEKVLVASNFTQIVHLLSVCIEQEFKTPVLRLTGATSDRGRVEIKERFNDPDDDARVLIVQSKTGGEAITLDACCSDLVIMDPLWTSDEETQLVSRIHRVSRIHQVMVHRLFSRNSVDGWMAAYADEQRAVIEANKPKARRRMALEAARWHKTNPDR
jgi:SNF2 family DNA or RNA helicase